MEEKLDIEHRLTKVEAQTISNSHRLDEMEKRQDALDSLATSVSALAAREERVENDVKEIKADVKTLAAKPAKKWENMEEKILWALIAAALGFVLAQVGL